MPQATLIGSSQESKPRSFNFKVSALTAMLFISKQETKTKTIPPIFFCSDKFAKGFIQQSREINVFCFSSLFFLLFKWSVILGVGALGSLSRVSHWLFHLTGLGRWIWEGPFALKGVKDLCSVLPHQKPLLFLGSQKAHLWTRTVFTRQNCTFSTVQCPGLFMSNHCTAMSKRGSQRQRALF